MNFRGGGRGLKGFYLAAAVLQSLDTGVVWLVPYISIKVLLLAGFLITMVEIKSKVRYSLIFFSRRLFRRVWLFYLKRIQKTLKICNYFQILSDVFMVSEVVTSSEVWIDMSGPLNMYQVWRRCHWKILKLWSLKNFIQISSFFGS